MREHNIHRITESLSILYKMFVLKFVLNCLKRIRQAMSYLINRRNIIS